MFGIDAKNPNTKLTLSFLLLGVLHSLKLLFFFDVVAIIALLENE